MNMKYKIIIAMITIAVSFAFGRYTAPNSSHTVEDINQNNSSDTSKNTHKQITTVTETLPDGTKRTTTTITDDISTDKKKDSDTQIHLDQTITATKNTLNVSALAGMDFTTNKPVYGASATRQLLGPITIGAYGLTNKTVGFSIGLNF